MCSSIKNIYESCISQLNFERGACLEFKVCNALVKIASLEVNWANRTVFIHLYKHL